MKLQKVGFFWITKTIYTSIYDITHVRVQISLAQNKQMYVNFISTPRWKKPKTELRQFGFLSKSNYKKHGNEQALHWFFSTYNPLYLAELGPFSNSLSSLSHHLTYPQHKTQSVRRGLSSTQAQTPLFLGIHLILSAPYCGAAVASHLPLKYLIFQ